MIILLHRITEKIIFVSIRFRKMYEEALIKLNKLNKNTTFL